MSPEKYTTVMVVKAGKRARKTAESNARQLVENANFLTKYCEINSQKQWDLSRRSTAVSQSQESFLVWTPSLTEEDSCSSVVPAFL